jgi:hypothetical protein
LLEAPAVLLLIAILVVATLGGLLLKTLLVIRIVVILALLTREVKLIIIFIGDVKSKHWRVCLGNLAFQDVRKMPSVGLAYVLSEA